MKDANYRPNGEVQGDTKDIPDRGTSRGMGSTYGADVGGDATNRMGKVDGAKSDPADQCMPSKAEKGRA